MPDELVASLEKDIPSYTVYRDGAIHFSFPMKKNLGIS